MTRYRENADPPSIFERKRPLAPATMQRIADGIRRYVIDAQQPFIVRTGHYSKKTGAGIVKGAGAGTFRGQPLTRPLATLCSTNDKNLVLPVLTKHYGGVVGHEVTKPLGTITATDSHALTAAFLERVYGPEGAERCADAPAPANPEKRRKVRAFLTKYYGGGESGTQGTAQSLNDPMHTIRGKACFGLVTIEGEDYAITDIGMRMLQPHELFAAQGFPADYIIDPEYNGKPLTKTAQIKMCGNSVVPLAAEAITRGALAFEEDAA